MARSRLPMSVEVSIDARSCLACLTAISGVEPSSLRCRRPRSDAAGFRAIACRVTQMSKNRRMPARRNPRCSRASGSTRRPGTAEPGSSLRHANIAADWAVDFLGGGGDAVAVLVLEVLQVAADELGRDLRQRDPELVGLVEDAADGIRVVPPGVGVLQLALEELLPGEAGIGAGLAASRLTAFG